MSHQSKVRFLVLPGFLACFFLAAVARAQFSGDPAVNLRVAGRTNERGPQDVDVVAAGSAFTARSSTP